ncbi:hypothetical protein CHM34_11050 [Paludifilum halophilum]|uniref:Uncharacterized protein n=1 Tax=Paludifilum halophilum TaxID=1642702 RepID=A0A235B560_9BACL|nr:hypothetical protein CHM34_11050 [Paludifilum halophilum]
MDGSGPEPNPPFYNIGSMNQLEEEVHKKQKEGKYRLFDLTFFNPLIKDETYVNRLHLSPRFLELNKYDDIKHLKTEDPLVNAHRTGVY